MKWQLGRSGGGYQKMTIFDCHWPLRWDMHILRVRSGAQVDPHRDELKGLKHWRLNIVIKQPKAGGDFVCEKTIINFSRLKLFRPDLHTHCVTKVEKGTRICLSVGWAMQL